ncbi:MAG: hypothetical protein ACE5IF_01065 [Candidatus Bathyarchaeia archaeon]
MRQSIRALGWATKILWIATAVFMVTSLYSPLKLMLERQVEIGSPQTSFSNGTITVSLPFFINNTGFYDISDLNVTTSVTDQNGTLISTSTTLVTNIPRGGSTNETHVMSISIDDIISKNLTYLLFKDTTIVLDGSVELRIAHILPLQVSTSLNMSWEAPLYNLSIGKIGLPERYNSTHHSTTAWLSFENHSPFNLNGTIKLETFNEGDEYVGSGTDWINVPSREGYRKKVTIYVPSDNILKFTETGKVHAYFESPMGSLDWWFTYGR